MAQKIIHATHPLKPHAIGLIAALGLQYLFGIIANLFVKFPEGEHEGQLWAFAWTQWPVLLHILLGAALLFGSLALLIRSYLQKDRIWKISSGIGFAGVLIAVIAGAKFIPTQTEGYSFIMAISFIVAIIAYFWGVYKGKSA